MLRKLLEMHEMDSEEDMEFSSSEQDSEDDDFQIREGADSEDGDEESLEDEVCSPAPKRPILQKKKLFKKKNIINKKRIEAYNRPSAQAILAGSITGSIPISDPSFRQNVESTGGHSARNINVTEQIGSEPPPRVVPYQGAAQAQQISGKSVDAHNKGADAHNKGSCPEQQAKGYINISERIASLEPPLSVVPDQGLSAAQSQQGEEHQPNYEKARRNDLRRLSNGAMRRILREERPYELELDADMNPCGAYKNYFDRKLNVLIKKHVDLSISDMRKIPQGQLDLVRRTLQDWFVIPWAEWDKKHWRTRLSKRIRETRRSVCDKVLRARKNNEEPTKPDWMKTDMWFRFLAYMETNQYKNSSSRNKKNRADQKRTNNTGRSGYAGTYMYLKQKMQRSPTTAEIADEAHTSKGYGNLPRGAKTLDLEEKSNGTHPSPSFNVRNTCKRVKKPIALHETFEEPREAQGDVTQMVDDAKSMLLELHKQIESLSAKKKKLEEDTNQEALEKVTSREASVGSQVARKMINKEASVESQAMGKLSYKGASLGSQAMRKVMNKEASLGSQGSAIPKFQKQCVPTKHVKKDLQENIEVQILELRNKSIIGHGRIFSVDPKKTCHCQPIGNGNASIMVQSINPGHLNDQLLYPTSEFTTFKDAINSLIIWPLSLLSSISQ